jgi:hypothetical protein
VNRIWGGFNLAIWTSPSARSSISAQITMPMHQTRITLPVALTLLWPIVLHLR